MARRVKAKHGFTAWAPRDMVARAPITVWGRLGSWMATLESLPTPSRDSAVAMRSTWSFSSLYFMVRFMKWIAAASGCRFADCVSRSGTASR